MHINTHFHTLARVCTHTHKETKRGGNTCGEVEEGGWGVGKCKESTVNENIIMKPIVLYTKTL